MGFNLLITVSSCVQTHKIQNLKHPPAGTLLFEAYLKGPLLCQDFRGLKCNESSSRK